MPDPITSAIIGSIIGSVVDGVLAPPPPPGPAMGIVRMLPEDAKVGEMLPPSQWEVQIDGKTFQLSPGVQFRNELNMIILPAMVQGSVRVRYVTDFSGAVHRVWILSAAEAAQLESR